MNKKFNIFSEKNFIEFIDKWDSLKEKYFYNNKNNRFF